VKTPLESFRGLSPAEKAAAATGLGALALGLCVLFAKSGRQDVAPAIASGAPIRPASPAPAGVAPALWQLLAQINAAWPARNKASDGIMGDASHQARASDHNTGLALDVTLDKDAGPDLDELAAALLEDSRVTYVIWRARIANRDIQSGAWRPYSGANPHNHHLHVSIRASARDDVQPWNLKPSRA